MNGYRFYVIFVDDFTKYTWMIPLKCKSDVFTTFIQFQAFVENLSRNKIGTFRIYLIGVFLSFVFKTHLANHGIQQHISCPYTPQQNSCAAHKYRYIVETTRSLLVASKVPYKFWAETFLTAMYLINRLPPPSKPSPWEQFFKKVVDYSQLKVFGCSCYPWLKPYTNSKLVAKSKLCVFIGYNLPHKCYKCLDPLTNKVYVSRHVYFNENTFPYHSISLCQTPHLSPS